MSSIEGKVILACVEWHWYQLVTPVVTKALPLFQRHWYSGRARKSTLARLKQLYILQGNLAYVLYCTYGVYCTMRLDQACAEFLTGYFSTHERGKRR